MNAPIIESEQQFRDALGDALLACLNPDYRPYVDLTAGTVGVTTDLLGPRRPDDPTLPPPEDHDIVWIPPISGEEGYKYMTDFVATLPTEEARDRLNLRLSWRKPFRNFLLALTPEELPLWTAYRTRCFHIAARFRLTDARLHFDGERPARLPVY
jgi:hypothetical protein